MWQTVKLSLFFIFKSIFAAQGTTISIILTLVCWYAVDYIFCKWVEITYGCEKMAPFDIIFILQDLDKNVQNVCGVILFETFDGPSMKKYLYGKIEHIHRGKSKLIKAFGTFWF